MSVMIIESIWCFSEKKIITSEETKRELFSIAPLVRNGPVDENGQPLVPPHCQEASYC